jgi:hypothetical protein
MQPAFLLFALFFTFVCFRVPALVLVCAAVSLSTNAVEWLLLFSLFFISQDVVCSPVVTLYG